MPSPPPVGDGRNGTTGATFSKDAGNPNLIEVTYDAAQCSGSKAVIVQGPLGHYAGYATCALGDAGHLGTASFDSSGSVNVWYNILWTDGSTAGHPGYAFDGTAYVPRAWSAAGWCGATVQDASHGTCP